MSIKPKVSFSIVAAKCVQTSAWNFLLAFQFFVYEKGSVAAMLFRPALPLLGDIFLHQLDHVGVQSHLAPCRQVLDALVDCVWDVFDKHSFHGAIAAGSDDPVSGQALRFTIAKLLI